jgi:hypothetical protein
LENNRKNSIFVGEIKSGMSFYPKTFFLIFTPFGESIDVMFDAFSSKIAKIALKFKTIPL